MHDRCYSLQDVTKSRANVYVLADSVSPLMFVCLQIREIGFNGAFIGVKGSIQTYILLKLMKEKGFRFIVLFSMSYADVYL